MKATRLYRGALAVMVAAIALSACGAPVAPPTHQWAVTWVRQPVPLDCGALLVTPGKIGGYSYESFYNTEWWSTRGPAYELDAPTNVLADPVWFANIVFTLTLNGSPLVRYTPVSMNSDTLVWLSPNISGGGGIEGLVGAASFNFQPGTVCTVGGPNTLKIDVTYRGNPVASDSITD